MSNPNLGDIVAPPSTQPAPATPSNSPYTESVPLETAAAQQYAAEHTSSPKVSTKQPAATSGSAGQGLPQLPKDIAGTITGQTLTPSQDIDSYLKTYADELSSLGPEYSKEMAYLAPYLTGGAPNSTNDQQAESIGQSISSGVQPFNANTPLNKALQSSENELGQATEAQTPAIEGLFNTASKEMTGKGGYESSIPYSDVLSSALAYGKSQLTYEGAGANTTGWTPEMQSLYSYLANAAGIGGVDQPGAATVAEAGLTQPTADTSSAPSSVPQADLTGGGNG